MGRQNVRDARTGSVSGNQIQICHPTDCAGSLRAYELSQRLFGIARQFG